MIKRRFRILLTFGLLLLTLWLQLAVINGLTVQWDDTVVVMILLILALIGVMFSFICDVVYRLIGGSETAQPGWLQPMSQLLAQRFGIKAPQVHLLAFSGINAFALDPLFKRSCVLLNTSVLTHLNQDEVEAVLAHEFSHIAGYHAQLLTFMQGMTFIVTLPLAMIMSLFYTLIYGLEKFGMTLLSVNHVMTVLLFPVTSIAIALFSRRWELQADHMAAEVIGREKYVRALQCLHASFFQSPNPLNHHYVADQQSDKYSWALSHPSLSQRIDALREVGL